MARRVEERKKLSGSWGVLMGVLVLLVGVCPAVQGRQIQIPTQPLTTKTNQTESNTQLAKCALAAGVMAASQGRLPLGKKVSLSYSRLFGHARITVKLPKLLVMQGLPVHERCSSIGQVRLNIRCLNNHCIDVDSRRYMVKGKAQLMIALWPAGVQERARQDTGVARVEIQADQVLTLRPLPFTQEECTGSHTGYDNVAGSILVRPTEICYLQCLLYFMSRVGPRRMIEHFEKCQDVFFQTDEEKVQVPPVVKVPDNLEFPFCILRDAELEDRMDSFMTGGPPRAEDPKLLVRCRYDEYGNKVCSTTDAAKIKCREVVRNNGFSAQRRAVNGTILQMTFSVPDYSAGSYPLADVFWYCGKDTQVKTTLEEGWTGICAPVVLTGRLTEIHRPDQPTRSKRSVWDKDQRVKISDWSKRFGTANWNKDLSTSSNKLREAIKNLEKLSDEMEMMRKRSLERQARFTAAWKGALMRLPIGVGIFLVVQIFSSCFLVPLIYCMIERRKAPVTRQLPVRPRADIPLSTRQTNIGQIPEHSLSI